MLIYNDSRLRESKDKPIGFEDSLISGTKIEIPSKTKSIQKRVNEVNAKRKRINEIEEKYDLTKHSEQKRNSRGYSFQDTNRGKEKGKLLGTSLSKGLKKNDDNEDKANVQLNASKITAHKREAFKHK